MGSFINQLAYPIKSLISHHFPINDAKLRNLPYIYNDSKRGDVPISDEMFLIQPQ